MSQPPEDLEKLRKTIDQIDEQLVSLLSKRAKTSQRIGQNKEGNLKINTSREAQIVRRVSALAESPLSEQMVQAVFRQIISGSLNLQRTLRVSYLGPVGTYSEEAARSRFGDMAEYIPRDNLSQVLQAVEQGKSDLAILPIENSIEGSVGQTLDLLLDTPLKICDELILPIHHQLLTNETSLKQISVVTAHPQALAQCRSWLATNLPQAKLIPTSSNAQAAQTSASQSRTAAIASKRAAEIYGLNTLDTNIEDSSQNTTRFVVLGPQDTTATGQDKTSIVCATGNKPGSLLAVLQQLASRKINMVKLESRPAKTGGWQYVFYIDIEGHWKDHSVDQTLKDLPEHTNFVKVLGSYPKAQTKGAYA